MLSLVTQPRRFTMSREFHIHVDAQVLNKQVEDELVKRYGFEVTNFSGHPEGVPHFEPTHHLTFKCCEAERFRGTFDQAKAYLESVGIHGYLEGEVLASDIDIAPKPFDPSVLLNLSIQMEPIAVGTFRQTELHVTLDRDRSDPRLIAILSGTGMFGAYLPKSYGTAVIYTAQGDRARVGSVLQNITEYLRRAGGSVACSVKEERVVRWWVSGEDVPLPPVIKSIA